MSNSENNTQALTRESEIATNAIETRTWKKNLFILKTLVGKDFKVKYRRSVLGVVWSVLNPLLMMIVMSAVFSYMFRFNIENFPLYLILGQIMFNLMSDATSGAMQSIIGAASLIQKIKIEKMVFPLEKVIFSLVNFLFSAIAAVAVMIYFRIMPTWDILFLPLCIVYVVAFSAGLGLILSSLAVFFRDVIHLWSVVLTAWTYVTPLFYPLELLPDTLQFLIQFNPMYQYITYFRDIMMYGITPTLEQNLICIAMAAISLALGILVFRKTEHKFILYV